MAQQQGGMFGPTPEEIQYALAQQQQDADWKQAGAWGNQSLGQQISTGAYAGGAAIGRGLEGLGKNFGIIPQDPRLAEAQKMMQIKKNIMESGIDPQDIDKFYPEIINQLYKGGMIDKAVEFEKQYQGISNQQDAIQARKDLAAQKRKETEMPGYKFIQPLMKGLEKNPENAKIVNKFIQSVTPQNPTGDVDLLAELEAKISGVKVKHIGEDGPTGLPAYQNEDGSDAAWYRDPKTGQKVTITSGLRPKAASVKVGGSTLTLPSKATDLVTDFNKGQQKYIDMFDNAQRAKTLINEAKASNNSQTWEAARTTIAKAVGQDKLSNEDIRRTGVDPRLVQGALDWFNKKISGVPNEDIMKQLYVLASILERDAKMRGDRYVDQNRAAVRRETPDFKDIEQLFPYMGVNPAAPAAPAGQPTLRWDGKQLVPIGQ